MCNQRSKVDRMRFQKLVASGGWREGQIVYFFSPLVNLIKVDVSRIFFFNAHAHMLPLTFIY